MTDVDEGTDQLLELYKLHTELADRVSQRRDGANRLFVSVLGGMVTFLIVSIRIGIEGLPADTMMFWAGIFGTLLSANWCVVLRSYRRLNSGKFAVLLELESRLDYQFFAQEREELKKKRYRRLTVVESALPYIFLVMFAGLAIYPFIAGGTTGTC